MMQGETKVSKESWFRVWNRYAGPPAASAAAEDKDMKVSVDKKEEVAKPKVEEKSKPKKEKAEPAPAAVSVGGKAANPVKKMEKEYYMGNVGPPVNKLIIALVSGLGLGGLGLDRCYMGQRWMGCLKLITFGGCGIWACVDWVVLTINCLMFWSSINAVGFRAVWMKDTITPAFWISILILALKFGIMPFAHKKVRGGKQEEEP